MFGLLLVVSGCVTDQQQGTWQRMDGQLITGNAALTQKWDIDLAACNAEVSKMDAGSNAPANRRQHAANDIFLGCMMQRQYKFVRT